MGVNLLVVWVDWRQWGKEGGVNVIERKVVKVGPQSKDKTDMRLTLLYMYVPKQYLDQFIFSVWYCTIVWYGQA